MPNPSALLKLARLGLGQAGRVGLDGPATERAAWFGAGLVVAAASGLLMQAAGVAGGLGAAPPEPPPRPSLLPLRVQVVGEVARPGLYDVPPPARVEDAIALAGGLTEHADAAEVNLVAHLSDGQRIVVPRKPLPSEAVPTPTRPPRRLTPRPARRPTPGAAEVRP